MTTDELRSLVVVATERQLTAAARRLGITQPGLSRQLQSLERELGTKLLVRTSRGVSLTEAGERFLLHAQRALDALRMGTSELQEMSATPRGPVALGVVPSVGAYLLPDLLPRIRAQLPEVLIRLTQSHQPDALESQVASGRLDLAVVILPVRRVDLVAQKLWQEEFVLAVPRDHRLAALKRPVPLSEVVGEPLLVVPDVPATQALKTVCEEQGQTPRIALEADNSESILRMVEHGLGVALLPAIIARAGPHRSFAIVRVSRGGLTRQVALIHRGDSYLSAAARALKQELVSATARPESRKG
jgi:DNA-binding transcriptional LysR family regulator